MTGRQRPKNGGGTGASTRSGTGWQAVAFAIFAAALYAVSTPVSKLLLRTTGPAMLAALLYLGAGIGMGAVGLIKKKTPVPPASRFVWGDVPFLVLMVVLDIAAPILMMLGLKTTGAASASLLNNAEIVATSLIALCLFGERIRPRLWVGIALVTAASCLLSFDGTASLAFSAGSLYVLSACLCWGLENNCTRRLSGRDPLKIVVVKGIFSGLGALAVAWIAGEAFPAAGPLLAALGLGFVAYGLSIFFYIRAQRDLGAARTSAYYAFAPFLGTALSFLFFPAVPAWTYFAALPLMLAGAYLALPERAPGGKLDNDPVGTV